MASDLSSVDDDIEIFEEKEEGEISLEDVSSSEESHPNCRPQFRTVPKCPQCMSTQACATWCVAGRPVARTCHRSQGEKEISTVTSLPQVQDEALALRVGPDPIKLSSWSNLLVSSKDAAYGKENRRGAKDAAGAAMSKHSAATLQEKNDECVPISSDSDMEIVGLPGNSKQFREKSNGVKVRRRKKKKRSRSGSARAEEAIALLVPAETYVAEVPVVKKGRSSRSHHRESSPPRYRSPAERGVAETSSRRYRKVRLPRSRSPGQRSASPVGRSGNLVDRKSLRKPRSPRKSPAKISQFREVDTQATKLLKKVRRLESVGIGSKKDSSKNREHSSLKEKLDNMMRTQAEVNHDKLRTRKRRESTATYNDNGATNGASSTVPTDDEEDDIDLLRRKALETKRKKSEAKDQDSTLKIAVADDSDDNDIDPNQLRILALQSAVMKKHQQRLARGIKSGRPKKPTTRVESPFNESFLDDFHITDGEDDDENENLGLKSSAERLSPILNSDSNNTEDMDLDTDVEREKEIYYAPYSPTDDLTKEISLVATLSEINDDDDDNNETQKMSPERIEKEPTIQHQISAEPTSHTSTNENASSSIDIDDEKKVENSLSPNTKNCSESQTTTKIDKIDESLSVIEKNVDPEVPYSPTDNLILDPDLFPIFPNIPIASSSNQVAASDDNEKNAATTEEHTNSPMVVDSNSTESPDTNDKMADSTKVGEMILPTEEDDNECESFVTMGARAEVALRAIDDTDRLPEVDLDGSPLVQVSEDHESTEVVIPIDVSPSAHDDTDEPLYLQCLDDSTKDNNHKMATIVNRTLVPTHILKTNKQLQQPLPQKKLDNHSEPTFKSAEMQPVSVETMGARPSTSFKPIKLCPISKKSQVMTTAAAAFNTSFGDDSAMEMADEIGAAIVEIPAAILETKRTDSRTSEKKKCDSKTQSRRDGVKNDEKTFTSDKSSVWDDRSIVDRGKIGKSNSKESPMKKQTRNNDDGKKIIGNKSTDVRSLRRSVTNVRKNRQSTKNRETVEESKKKKSERKKNAKQRARERRIRLMEESVDGEHLDTSKLSTTVDGDRRIKDGGNREKKVDERNKMNVDHDDYDDVNGKRAKKDLAAEARTSTAKKMEADKMEAQTMDPNNMEAEKKMETKRTEDDKKMESKIMEAEKAMETKKLEAEKTKEVEKNRRSSIDEDEEALRAQLLASLSKRTTRPISQPVVVNSTTLPDPSAIKSSQPQDPKNSTTTTKDVRDKMDVSIAATKINQTVLTANPSLTSSAPQISSNVNTAKQFTIPPAPPTENPRPPTTSNLMDVPGPSSSPRKRSSSTILKGPPKKIVKKISPVITSTRVVNNAKKYQNALLQKKLLQRGTTTIYNTQNGSRNITLNNLKMNDVARPSSPKTSVASKMPQLIINLESDTDTENESDDRTSGIVDERHTRVEDRKPLTIPATDFEKSVEQFLREQRMKQEAVVTAKAMANHATTSTVNKVVGNSPLTNVEKLSGIDNTPLAVRRHLPMSQQEEYRRLRQKIADHERQKRQKTMENCTTLTNPIVNAASCTPCTPSTPPGPLSPASPIVSSFRTQQIVTNKSPKNSPQPIPMKPTTVVSTSTKKIQIHENTNSPKTIQTTKSNDEKLSTNEINKIFKPTLTELSKKNLTTISNSSKNMSNIIFTNSSISTNSTKSVVTTNSRATSFIVTTSTSKAQIPVERRSTNVVTSPRNSPTNLDNFVKNDRTEKPKSTFNSSTMNNQRWNSETAKKNAKTREFSNSTEMLTIKIPNDKLQTERLSNEVISKRENSSSPMNRSFGMLRILTTEQLNNRSVKIEVQQDSGVRKVTVKNPAAASRDDVRARSVTSVTFDKNFVENRCDNEKQICCDSNLDVNEMETDVGEEVRSDESLIVDNGDSTRVFETNKVVGNDDNVDFGVRTIERRRDDDEGENGDGNFESSTHEATNDDSSSRQDVRETSKSDDCEEKICGKQLWEKIRLDVKNELEVLETLGTERQRIILMESQEKLVAKRNSILDDLTDMSGFLRQLDADREIQTQLVAEVQRLREQLFTAEENLREQRRRMNGTSGKVTKVHEKINHGRRECYKLTGICHGLGNKIIGEDYKLPETGAQLLHERLKEVAVHTRQLSKKKVPSVGSLNDSRDSNSSMSPSPSRIPILENSPVEKSSVSMPSNSITTTMEIVVDDSIPKKNFENPAISSMDNSSQHNDSHFEITKNVTEEKNEYHEAFARSTEIQTPLRSNDNFHRMENEETTIRQDTNAQKTNEDNVETSAINAQTREEATNLSDCHGNDDSIIVITNPEKNYSEENIVTINTLKCVTQEQSSRTKIDDYESVLKHFKSSRTVNPDGILCPYELMGTCSDGDCQFLHLNPGHCH